MWTLQAGRPWELIDRYDNLIVVQTFSKARSMAGMRVGYAISNPETDSGISMMPNTRLIPIP